MSKRKMSSSKEEIEKTLMEKEMLQMPMEKGGQMTVDGRRNPPPVEKLIDDLGQSFFNTAEWPEAAKCLDTRYEKGPYTATERKLLSALFVLQCANDGYRLKVEEFWNALEGVLKQGKKKLAEDEEVLAEKKQKKS